MLFYELGQQMITKYWSIEKNKILRAKFLGLPHQHIRLLPVSLKVLNLEKNLVYLLSQIYFWPTIVLDFHVT